MALRRSGTEGRTRSAREGVRSCRHPPAMPGASFARRREPAPRGRAILRRAPRARAQGYWVRWTALRLLIVNADDFGYSRGVNRGIVEAYERGIVTSASLMVNRVAAAEAAEYGRDHPELGVGLHVDLRRRRVRERLWSRERLQRL